MTVSGLTLLSRVLGLLRDVVINHHLGQGATSDAWNAAFQFPNLFRRVFGEGAFNAAFVPSYSSKLKEGEEQAFTYGSKVIVLLAMILAVLFLLCFIFVWPIMKLCNPGYAPETLELTVSLARITMGYLFFVCLLAGFSAILNSHRKFFAPAFSYAFLNIAFLGGLFVAVPIVKNPVQVLVWSLLAAGVIQLAVVVIPAYRMGFRVNFKIPKLDDDIKKLGILMLPGLLSAGIQQLNLLVGGWVVSFQEGGKTVIYNADRINQLPLGLIGIAFGVVLLPEITKRIKDDQYLEARASLQTGMVHAMFLTLPAMIGMAVLAEPILYVLFEGGKFDGEDARISAQALLAFAFGCPAYVIARVLQPGYFAREDTKTPMKFTLISAVVNILLCFIAFVFLKGSGKLHIGCAAATSVAGWVNVFLLGFGLRKFELIRLGMRFWRKMGRMLIASCIMGVGIYFASELLHEPIHTEAEGLRDRFYRTIVLLLVISGGGALYFTIAHFIKAMTVRELKSGFKRS